MMVWRYVNQLPILMIKLYQAFLSPLLGSSCRFVPTCSSYGLEAFQHYNPLYASWLTFWRILRCNPFSKGGYDPLPLRVNNSSGKTNECCNG